MANNIRGITIEIGGDTTKLDKALSGTNKKLNETQKDLKAVEKALKMDPGNTELLEQKQRLLANAVEATGEKLNTLREAAKSADEALARGQAYEAKYAPLKQEIDEVSASLKGLQANQEQMSQRSITSITSQLKLELILQSTIMLAVPLLEKAEPVEKVELARMAASSCITVLRLQSRTASSRTKTA